MGIYSSLMDVNLENTINEFSGKNFSEFKKNLSQVLVDKIIPISNEIKKLLKEKNFLDQILDNGRQKANKISSEKLKKFKKSWVFKYKIQTSLIL
tara:strand:- start:1104 stop:1388 length:285 start_codon:yes stop_codon:yes gene_type:complete